MSPFKMIKGEMKDFFKETTRIIELNSGTDEIVKECDDVLTCILRIYKIYSSTKASPSKYFWLNFFSR